MPHSYQVIYGDGKLSPLFANWLTGRSAMKLGSILIGFYVDGSQQRIGEITLDGYKDLTGWVR